MVVTMPSGMTECKTGIKSTNPISIHNKRMKHDGNCRCFVRYSKDLDNVESFATEQYRHLAVFADASCHVAVHASPKVLTSTRWLDT